MTSWLEIIGALTVGIVLMLVLFTLGLLAREFVICGIQSVRARMVSKSPEGRWGLWSWLRLTWWLFTTAGTFEVGGKVIPRNPFEPVSWPE